MESSNNPIDFRELVRNDEYSENTAGQCPGYIQANVVILPSMFADEFEYLCVRNPRALPLLERSHEGYSSGFELGRNVDIRTDIPRYTVFEHGRRISSPTSIEAIWRDDFVTFLLGCSFSAESALLNAGVRLKHLELGQGIPMYRTTIDCVGQGGFRCSTVVSMRPVKNAELEAAIRITSARPHAHGAPLHVGAPGEIGIRDIGKPDWGTPIEVASDEVPVFWGCGVTPQMYIEKVRPSVAITHFPQHMLITDRLEGEDVLRPKGV